jgi:hypothetical protein
MSKPFVKNLDQYNRLETGGFFIEESSLGWAVQKCAAFILSPHRKER